MFLAPADEFFVGSVAVVAFPATGKGKAGIIEARPVATGFSEGRSLCQIYNVGL